MAWIRVLFMFNKMPPDISRGFAHNKSAVGCQQLLFNFNFMLILIGCPLDLPVLRSHVRSIYSDIIR